MARGLSKLSRSELEHYPTEVLDREAFGFASGDTIKVPLDAIHIKYQADLEDAESDVASVAMARVIFERAEPVDLALRNGQLELEDGHHRYVAARMLGKKTLKAIVDIHDNPITEILAMRKPR
jgi:hypothetical protein